MRTRGRNDDSGSILLTMLWVLVILILFVAGMGRRGSVDAGLARLAAGQARAKYIAWSGLGFALARVAEDSNDELTSQFDTLGQCGFRIGDARSAQELFRHVPAVPHGYFDILAPCPRPEGAGPHGFCDEERRINLNAVTPDNYLVLKFLVMDLGYEEQTGETIAASVVDWIDSDSMVYKEPYGNEEVSDPATGRAPVKNGPFQSLPELLLVKGVTPELFDSLKTYLTVIPRSGPLTVNFETASGPVLRALARSFAGGQTNTTLGDADGLVDKILHYRKGRDRMDGTLDDRMIEETELFLNSREENIMALMKDKRTKVSNYLRMAVRGVDESTGARAGIEAVVSRVDGSVVYWHRI